MSPVLLVVLYRREDEIGTPLCVTVDFDTIDDNVVTIREPIPWLGNVLLWTRLLIVFAAFALGNSLEAVSTGTSKNKLFYG